jgi:hypothetical protein
LSDLAAADDAPIALKYDDGFVAFLNGAHWRRRIRQTLCRNSAATISHEANRGLHAL